MKASVGGDRHRLLKQFAIKKAIAEWGDRVFVVTQEVDRFELRVTAGIGNYRVEAEKDICPDIALLLADGVQKTKERGYADKRYVNPNLVLIECENSRQSTLIRGTQSVRLYAYLLLRERYRRMDPKNRPLFVLVTWTGNKDAYNEVGLWDHVWYLEGEGADETVQEDAPIDREGEEP